ncbi:MAG: C40 family peptidase [Gemmatimonadota bacterium]|nr:C40 family peptidase [Gemmatimonadota bacterium]
MNPTHASTLRALLAAAPLLVCVPLAAQQARLPSQGAARILASPPGSSAATADSLIELARAQVGRRYLFGGNGPVEGFDCSGFTRYLMRALNVSLPRTANEQAGAGREIPRDPRFLRIGDLLTFGSEQRITHVGVYIGNGRYVHASSVAGQVVESRLDHRESSLVRAWRGARRVMAERDATSVAGR